jgi:hypothetical protein
MKPLASTDAEFDAVFSAARPLDPALRDPFLQAVATALQGCSEIGPGAVFVVCRELQRQFFDPPLDEPRAVSRWARHEPRYEKVSKRAV